MRCYAIKFYKMKHDFDRMIQKILNRLENVVYVCWVDLILSGVREK